MVESDKGEEPREFPYREVWMADGSFVSLERARELGVPEEVINAALIEADELIFGVSYVDVTGKRIDPLSVDLP